MQELVLPLYTKPDATSAAIEHSNEVLSLKGNDETDAQVRIAYLP